MTMSKNDAEAELRALKDKQNYLEKEVSRLRKLVEPATYLDWWNRVDTNWKILFMQNVRSERSWAEAWRWASDWSVDQYQPTPKFWEKSAQIQVFCCSLQRHLPKITSLQPLAHFTQLIGLHCGQSDVDDLEPIGHLTDIRYLDIYNTHIDDLRPIAGWTELEILNYQHHFSQEKDDLYGFRKLKSLNIRYSRLDDLACLSSLTELEYLNIGYTHARSLKPLYGHTKLKKIYMPKTPIPAQEISEFIELHPDCDMGFEPGDSGWLGN